MSRWRLYLSIYCCAYSRRCFRDSLIVTVLPPGGKIYIMREKDRTKHGSLSWKEKRIALCSEKVANGKHWMVSHKLLAKLLNMIVSYTVLLAISAAWWCKRTQHKGGDAVTRIRISKKNSRKSLRHVSSLLMVPILMLRFTCKWLWPSPFYIYKLPFISNRYLKCVIYVYNMVTSYLK